LGKQDASRNLAASRAQRSVRDRETSNRLNITKARISGYALFVTIDGREFFAGEKYTILEMGYAVYTLHDLDRDSDSAQWILANGETIPPDKSAGRAAVSSTKTMLITSHPILFALAYKFWWHLNGEPLPENELLQIPALEQSFSIQRNRRILNDFNLKYKGKLPKPYSKLTSKKR
jgi:hypothetical protein